MSALMTHGALTPRLPRWLPVGQVHLADDPKAWLLLSVVVERGRLAVHVGDRVDLDEPKTEKEV